MKMWSGRFREPLDTAFEQWQRSFGFDWQLLPQEIAASKAHATVLAAAGMLTPAECSEVRDGLDAVLVHEPVVHPPALRVRVAGPVVEVVGGRDQVPGVREGRAPLPLIAHGVAADVITVHVRVDDEVHVLGADAGQCQPAEEVAPPDRKSVV